MRQMMHASLQLMRQMMRAIDAASDARITPIDAASDARITQIDVLVLLNLFFDRSTKGAFINNTPGVSTSQELIICRQEYWFH